jgi:hypothetical protein
VPRNLLQLGLWAAIFAGSALAQSALTGRVLALSEGDRIPAAGAWVVASSGAPLRTIATVQADAQGSYRLEGLPEGRVEFTVSHRGYFTLEAGGSTSATLARTCPVSDSCGEADFLLAKASVVDGYVSNPFGDPVSETLVLLTPIGQGADQGGSRHGIFRTLQQTDDHGYFRFYNVPAGKYDLIVELRDGNSREGNARAYTAEPEKVRVETGADESVYISLAVKSDPVRIGGSIAGLDLVGDETVRIIAAPPGGAGRFRPRIAADIDVDTSEDAHQISGEVPPGEYVLMAEIREPGSGRRPGAGRMVPLGRYRIDHDMTDLRLVAHEGATFQGRIRFDGVPQQRASLFLVPLDEGGTPASFGAAFGAYGLFGPRGRRSSDVFERRALLPGRYRLKTNAEAYFIASETEFVLSEGQTLERKRCAERLRADRR